MENVQEVLLQPNTGDETAGGQGKLISEENSEEL